MRRLQGQRLAAVTFEGAHRLPTQPQVVGGQFGLHGVSHLPEAVADVVTHGGTEDELVVGEGHALGDIGLRHQFQLATVLEDKRLHGAGAVQQIPARAGIRRRRIAFFGGWHLLGIKVTDAFRRTGAVGLGVDRVIDVKKFWPS